MTHILIVALSLTLLAPVQPQTGEPRQRPKPAEGKAGIATRAKGELSPLQKRAVDLIDQLSQTAKQIDDDLLKLRVRTVIADVVWEYNQDRSHQLFEEVYNAAYSLLADMHAAQTNHRRYGTAEHQMYAYVLKALARRSPELAEKLQQKKVPDVVLSPEEAQYTSPSLEFAGGIADTDPERAARIVSNSLAEGVKRQALSVLTQIRYKNPALADRLFLQVLNAARSNPSFMTSTLGYISPQGLGAYVLPDAAEPGDPLNGAAPVNPAVVIPYLEFIYDLAMKAGDPSQQDRDPQLLRLHTDLYKELRRLSPYFNQYLPDKAAAVAARMQYLAEYVHEGTLKKLTDPLHPVEDLLEKARTAQSTQERDQFLSMAASYANVAGDPERSLSIALEIRSEAKRSSVESMARTTGAQLALAKGDVEKACRYARDISETGSYVFIFERILQAVSSQMNGQKDKQKAEENKQRMLDIISEVERFLARADRGAGTAVAALMIAEAAVPIDPNRAFDLMQLAVKALNYTDAGDPESIKKGEIQPTPFPVEKVDFGRSLTLLVKTDPERALWLAQSLVRKDLNVLAQLAVCRGMLTKKEEAEVVPAPPAKEGQKQAAPGQKGDKEAPAAAPGKKKTD